MIALRHLPTLLNVDVDWLTVTNKCLQIVHTSDTSFNNTKMSMKMLARIVACVAGGIRERAKLAREFASGEAASE